MMKFAIIACIIIAAISLLLNIYLSMKVNHLYRHLHHHNDDEDDGSLKTSNKILKMGNRLTQVEAFNKSVERFIRDTYYNHYHKDVNDRLLNCEAQIKSLKSTVESLQKKLQQSKSDPVDKPKEPVTHVSDTTSEANVNSDRKGRNEGNIPKNGKASNQNILKIIFLDLNSEEFFFDYSDQKSGTSKFIAYLTSDNEATFEPIDVERVRSANVSASLQQSGAVPIKDAQSFKVISKGKIKKESNGEWHIESPVVVEFIK